MQNWWLKSPPETLKWIKDPRRAQGALWAIFWPSLTPPSSPANPVKFYGRKWHAHCTGVLQIVLHVLCWTPNSGGCILGPLKGHWYLREMDPLGWIGWNFACGLPNISQIRLYKAGRRRFSGTKIALGGAGLVGIQSLNISKCVSICGCTFLDPQMHWLAMRSYDWGGCALGLARLTTPEKLQFLVRKLRLGFGTRCICPLWNLGLSLLYVFICFMAL